MAWCGVYSRCVDGFAESHIVVSAQGCREREAVDVGGYGEVDAGADVFNYEAVGAWGALREVDGPYGGSGEVAGSGFEGGVGEVFPFSYFSDCGFFAGVYII